MGQQRLPAAGQRTDQLTLSSLISWSLWILLAVSGLSAQLRHRFPEIMLIASQILRGPQALCTDFPGAMWVVCLLLASCPLGFSACLFKNTSGH